MRAGSSDRDARERLRVQPGGRHVRGALQRDPEGCRRRQEVPNPVARVRLRARHDRGRLLHRARRDVRERPLRRWRSGAGGSHEMEGDLHRERRVDRFERDDPAGANRRPGRGRGGGGGHPRPASGGRLRGQSGSTPAGIRRLRVRVPFVDLVAQYHAHKQEFDEALAGVIEAAAFIGGAPVREFERRFAEAYGVRNCIACGNGTQMAD